MNSDERVPSKAMLVRCLSVISAISFVACSSGSDATPPPAGHDAASSDVSIDTATTTETSATTDSTAASDAPIATDDSGADSFDAATPDCPGAEVVASGKQVGGRTQVASFAGSLWASGYPGFARVALPSGTITEVTGIDAFADLFPHGAKLLAVSGSDVVDLDPATLAITKLAKIPGGYSSYMPRTAFDGKNLWALHDVSATTELGMLDLATSTWTPRWSGDKVDSLHHGGQRSYVVQSRKLLALPDPGSSAPEFASEGDVIRVVSDDVAVYFMWQRATDTGPDVYRLAHDSATPEKLHMPVTDEYGYLAINGDHLAVTWITWATTGDLAQIHSVVRSAGAWSKPLCRSTSAFLGDLDTSAIIGDALYVAISAGFDGQIVRIPLP